MFIKKLLFAILGIFLIFITSLFIYKAFVGQNFSGRDSSEILEKKLRLIFIRCNSGKTRTLSSQDFNCLGRGIAPLVQKDNLEPLMDALSSLYSSEPDTNVLGIAQCHLPAHIIGSEAVKRGLSFNEVFRGCSTKCSYGCVHGAYSQNFSKDPRFLSDFTNTCSKYLENPSLEDMHSCWHITGHWLGELLRGNVDQAIKDCMKLPEKDGGKDYCISGLRMELLVGSPPKNLSRSILTDLTTKEFCNKFPEKYRPECYSESGFYVFRAFGDIERTVKNCQSLGSAYRGKCATSAGVAFYFSSKDNASRVVNFCKAFGLNEKDCIYGALEISISESNFYSTAIAICDLEKNTIGNECYEQIGSKSLELNGRIFMNKICGELQGSEKTLCLEGGGF